MRSANAKNKMLVHKRRRMRTAAIALGMFLGLVIAEIGLRTLGVGFPSLYYPDLHCGSRLVPSTTGVWCEEGHGRFQTNSLGFRGPEIEPKATNVFRIAVLGDSFIEGLQVDFEQTFCAQLQQVLNSAQQTETWHPSGKRFEVINCGVSGYGTAQQLLMFREYVCPLEPDAVLLSVFPDNDLWNNSRTLSGDATTPYITIDSSDELVIDNSFRQSVAWKTAQTRYQQCKRYIVNRSRVLQVLKRTKLNWLHPSNQSVGPAADSRESLQAMIGDAIYVYREPEESDHQAAWEITERLIAELAYDCRSRNMAFVAFTASSPVQVHPQLNVRSKLVRENALRDLLYPDRRLEKFCQGADIPFVPLVSQIATSPESQTEFLHGFGPTLGLGHWNQAGHALNANSLAKNLIQNQRLLDARSSSTNSQSKKSLSSSVSR